MQSSYGQSRVRSRLIAFVLRGEKRPNTDTGEAIMLDDQGPSKTNKTRKFQSSWKDRNRWLELVTKKNMKFCGYCREFQNLQQKHELLSQIWNEQFPDRLFCV